MRENLTDDRAIHVRVSLARMLERLNNLDTIAHDPAAVEKWSEELWEDLTKCGVCYPWMVIPPGEFSEYLKRERNLDGFSS